MNELLNELNKIIEKSNDNIVITDGQGIVLRASPSCIDIYGVEVDALLGKSVFELEKKGIFSPSISAKVLREKKQCQLMQHTNTGKIVMATAYPLVNEQNEIYRVISFSHDLTELENLKRDYEHLQHDMEKYELELKELRREHGSAEIVTKSKAMQQIQELIARVADTDATVVLLGESGVGKSMLARSLHEQSKRRNHALVEVNCSTIPETLFESEMFGYEAGAFTGAQKSGKQGLIEQADKGTLFLDEIAEMSLPMQAKLLKVIQEKTVTRLGGTTAKKVDFRLVVATNQNLQELVKRKKFREDLYFRLHVLPIEIPPLRERVEDIHLLAYQALNKFNQKYGTAKKLTTATVEALRQYTWSGNVRELENMMERLALTVSGDMIKPEDLPFNIQVDHPTSSPSISVPFVNLKEAKKAVEKEWLLRAYRTCRTTFEMADYLGISQPSVVRKLKEYKIRSKIN